MAEDLGIYAQLKADGVDTERLGESTAYRVASDIGSGLLSASTDAGAKGMNTVLDVANFVGVEEAVYSMINGDAEGFEPWRYSTMTDVIKDFRDVSALEEGTSDVAGIVGGMIISGGTKFGADILSWGSKGNIGRKVFAEAMTALPIDTLLSDTSGEHLLFDQNTEEDIINRRAKNIVENAGMGAIGDFALRGISKAYKTWRGAGKTADDATQAAFNKEVPAGQGDAVNKVRPTAELMGHPELTNTYIKNPMYKMENREELTEITPGVFKQMSNVSNAEYKVRKAVDVNFMKVSAKEDVPLDVPDVGLTPDDMVLYSTSRLQGRQDREDVLNIFDAWSSGKVTDEVSEKYTRRFLKAFLQDEVDSDVLKIMDGSLTGKERESAMLKIREKFRNNPFLVDERNFEDKAKIASILSQKLDHGFSKRRRSMMEVFESYKDLAIKADTDKSYAKSLRALAKDTGMDQEALMRNMAHLDVTTNRLSEYSRGLTELVDSSLNAMVNASKKLTAELKASGGKLDMGSRAFREWMTAFGASNEIYSGVANIKGNVGRALRSYGETAGSGMKSYLKQFDEYATKEVRNEAQEEASRTYMRAKQITMEHAEAVKNGTKKRKKPDGSFESVIELAQDPKAFTDELVDMIRLSSDIGRAKRLVSKSFKTEDQGLADMFISMGISNMLASPMTIGKIALSTANFVVYKQTLIPFYSGLANMVTKGDTGQRPLMDVAQRWLGMAEMAGKYLKGDHKTMSRGFRGMQIEGQGFTDMKFKDLLKFVDEKANNPISKFGGRLMSAPLWFGNQVMTKGIIPVDDFFRRSMLEAETASSIHSLYTKGLNAEPSITKDMVSSFSNFEDYRKTMLPLFTDVKNALYETREASNDEVRKKMSEIFNKYPVTRLDDDAQAVVMAEVLRAERRAAEAVSQETTDDMWLGRTIKATLNGIESQGAMGRVVASTLVPFQTAPINLMRSAMEETPGLNLLSKRWRDKYTSGVKSARRGRASKDRDEAIAQVLAGTTVGMGAWGIVNSLPVYGHIPIEEMRGAQEMGIQPYSIVLNGKAYSYDFLGTFKAPLAMMADFNRYGMEGNNFDAFKQALKTFALAAGNNPYFDSMQEMTSLFNSDVSEKDLIKFVTSKSTQFLQIGSGLNRAVKAGMGGEVETSALSEYYDSVWLRELDMRNKDNPAYRFFRDFTNPKAYTRKTNLFGDGLTRNGGSPSAFLPYLTMGISNTPAPTSPGLVLLKELELVNQDFSEIGDVVLDSARADEVKERVFKDSGLGLGRLLNSYASDPGFMGASDSYRKGVISKLVTDHVSQVQSNMGLDVIEKQYEIDELNRKLDFDSHGAELDISASARRMGEYIYGMEKSKIDKGTIKTQGVDQILK